MQFGKTVLAALGIIVLVFGPVLLMWWKQAHPGYDINAYNKRIARGIERIEKGKR